ncbi:hypothetical protein [Rathayibacter sp. VKM Ac-2754]|uniref:hypothetical protein n=1 Tax=Rathayibacter sp. VKM Ac-2754 TaxID=2609251 RepID=UPI00135CDCBF|nr:hypothetical protein [Rathayibacter sp. VKM Ac-2754]MWV58594.1 hypothetical protein [Rathayibacter sp. VKM Ac-2754]
MSILSPLETGGKAPPGTGDTMTRYRRLLGAALLVGALAGCSADHGRALDAALAQNACVLESTVDASPRPLLSRSVPAVVEVDVAVSEECTLEQQTVIASTVAEAAGEALDGVPAWRTSSEYTQRVGDDVLAVGDVHTAGPALVAALEGWDALRRDVDGSVSVRTSAGDAAIDVELAATSDDTAITALARLLASDTAITRGVPEWTIGRPAGGGRPSSEVVVHDDRPADELVRLAQEVEAAFVGATAVETGPSVLNIEVRGPQGGDGARSLVDSAVWPSVLATMTAMTDRGAGYAIGGVIDAEAADGSGRVVDDFASSSMMCAAPSGGGATTRAAFAHLDAVIRPAHPGESFPHSGLSAPTCR